MHRFKQHQAIQIYALTVYENIILTYFFHKVNQYRKVVTIPINKSIIGESAPWISFAFSLLRRQKITVEHFRFPKFQSRTVFTQQIS